MATCKDCIHYDICIFHLKDNDNENCVRFKNTADVVPRSEIYDDHNMQVTCYTLGCQEGDKIRKQVAREIFEEIDGITDLFAQGLITELELYDLLGNLKKKYTETAGLDKI